MHTSSVVARILSITDAFFSLLIQLNRNMYSIIFLLLKVSENYCTRDEYTTRCTEESQ